jgi:putative membrane protein
MLYLFAEIWRPSTMTEGLLSVVAFGAIGIIMAIIGFKLFDWITPGNLGEEITSKNNMAAAILAGAVVLGVSIIMAAAIHG